MLFFRSADLTRRTTLTVLRIRVFAKNICGMADFVKKLARIDGFADPYSHPFANIKMNLDTGKYHPTL